MINRGLKTPAEMWKDDRALAQWCRQAFGPAVSLPHYAKANLPSAAENIDGMVIVTDETGGRVPAFSDGTKWRRVTDRAIVS